MTGRRAQPLRAGASVAGVRHLWRQTPQNEGEGAAAGHPPQLSAPPGPHSGVNSSVVGPLQSLGALALSLTGRRVSRAPPLSGESRRAARRRRRPRRGGRQRRSESVCRQHHTSVRFHRDRGRPRHRRLGRMSRRNDEEPAGRRGTWVHCDHLSLLPFTDVDAHPARNLRVRM